MTTPTLWLDAAFAGNEAQVKAAVAAGAKGAGFYLPGEGVNEDPYNQWTVAQVAAVRNWGFGRNMVPIWVPKPSLPGDPTDSANRAYQAAVSCGCTPKLAGLYSGNHIETTGQITGPVWLPIPGAEPKSVGSQSAIQWGTVSELGWSIDWDIAAADFPWNTVLMVDYEYNTVGGQFGINWYHAFQTRIAQLGNTTPPPAPKPPAPAPTPVPTPGTVSLSGTPGTILVNNQLHVFTDAGNGTLIHRWYDYRTGQWGREIRP